MEEKPWIFSSTELRGRVSLLPRKTETLFHPDYLEAEIVREGSHRQPGWLVGIKSHRCADKGLGKNYLQQSLATIHGLPQIH